MKSETEHINWQKRVKEEHKDRILTLLRENKTMRFKDFVAQSEKTGIRSEKGLSEVLQRLLGEGLIEKTNIYVEMPKGEIKKGLRGEVLEGQARIKQVSAYKLTSQGKKYQSWWLIHELSELKDNNASYIHSWSGNYYVFGSSFDLAISSKAKNLSPILPSVYTIEEFIMLNAFKNIKEKGIKLEPSEGKILISFEIDFSLFTSTLVKIQSFIEDIDSNKDIFSDTRLDFDKKEVNKLWHLDFLVRFSSLLGDDTFIKNLRMFLANFSKGQKFYDLTKVDPHLFNRFIKMVNEGKDPLKDRLLFKSLIHRAKVGIGYDNIFSTYIKAAKIARYGDVEFYERLDGLEHRVDEKINEMLMGLSKRELKKLEAKQKRDAK